MYLISHIYRYCNIDAASMCVQSHLICHLLLCTGTSMNISLLCFCGCLWLQTAVFGPRLIFHQIHFLMQKQISGRIIHHCSGRLCCVEENMESPWPSAATDVYTWFAKGLLNVQFCMNFAIQNAKYFVQKQHLMTSVSLADISIMIW